MIRNFGNRIAILTLVLLTFSTMALANGGSTFRLVLEDTTTGVERVITDNQILGGAFNPDGDKANTTLGTIQFTSSIGNFFVTLTATSTTGDGGILTLNANVTNQSASADQFVAFLEDTYSTGGAAATLTNTINSATLSAATLSVQSWLDPSGAVPAFGANTGQTPIANANGPGAIPGTGVVIPTDNPYNDVGVSSIAVTQGAPNTSIFSEAAVQFTGQGSANFSFTATDPSSATLSEPTSLMLLGSALLGGGVLRRMRQK
jgi:hypothetical protein